MDFTQVAQQIAILFIIMFLGYYLRRSHIIDESGIKNFSAFIFYVTMPAMILASMSQTKLEGTGDIGQALIASLISYTLFVVVAFFIPRLLRVKPGSKGLFSFMTIFANVAFIGFPMLTTIIGPSAVFFGAIINIPFSLLLYTLGIYFIMTDKDADHKLEISLKKFLNPGILMTLLAMGFMVLGVEIPTVLLGTARSLGAVTTPLAMIVVGASLYGVNIKDMFRNYRVIVLSLIRMILFPLIIGLILRGLGMSSMVIAVSVVLAGMPVGTNTVIIARQYDGDVLDASEAVFLSTLLMLVTTPFLIMMVQQFS